MSQDTTIEVGPEWVELTNSDVTDSSLTFQNIGARAVYVAAVVDPAVPDAEDEGFIFAPLQGESGRSLADLFPGVAGANRLYSRTVSDSTASSPVKVKVSHA
jgi:hypothetical protein